MLTTRDNTEAFTQQAPIERSTMNSWGDEAFVAAVEQTGRTKIVLGTLEPARAEGSTGETT
jgi:hypothetical protein